MAAAHIMMGRRNIALLKALGSVALKVPLSESAIPHNTKQAITAMNRLARTKRPMSFKQKTKMRKSVPQKLRALFCTSGEVIVLAASRAVRISSSLSVCGLTGVPHICKRSPAVVAAGTIAHAMR